MAETPLPILAWHGMAWLTTSGTEPTRQHDSSTHVVCRSTRLHFFGSCTGYASRSESSSGCMCSGISLYARHSTGVSACWQPAADIGGCCLSPSTLCRLSDDAGAINPSINSVTARRLWLQRGRGTVSHHRPGPPLRYWHVNGRPSLIFSVSHLADRYLALSLLIDS